MPLCALFRLGFPSPSTVTVLSLPHTLTRWLILLKARRQDFSLRPVVSVRFQILFHSPRRGSFHLSLTVLVRYRSSRVFSLGRWAARFPTMLACIVVLRILPRDSLLYTGLSPSMADLPRSFYFQYSSIPESYNPDHRSDRFGLFRFRSPLLAESSLFLTLLRCFSSGGSLPLRVDKV